MYSFMVTKKLGQSYALNLADWVFTMTQSLVKTQSLKLGFCIGKHTLGRLITLNSNANLFRIP